jgi:hypothetical protein
VEQAGQAMIMIGPLNMTLAHAARLVPVKCVGNALFSTSIGRYSTRETCPNGHLLAIGPYFDDPDRR